MSGILYGRPVAEAITAETAERAEALRKRGIVPALAIIRMGASPGAARYMQRAAKACEAAGVEAQCAYLPGTGQLRSSLRSINRDDTIHGVIFMRPLPDRQADDLIRAELDRRKDVDGMSLASMAAVFAGRGRAFAPCPARAALELLDYYGVELAGRRVAVTGQGLMVGRPLAILLPERGATVTICGPGTPGLPGICRESDVIICGLGTPGPLGAECFREGQTVLDVGGSLTAEGRAGCVDMDAALAAGAAVSPANGGVDDVSYAVLALHTVQAAEAQSGAL